MKLVPDHPRCFSRGLGLGLRVHDEDAELGRSVIVSADGGSKLPLADGAVQSRGASGAQHCSGDIENRSIGIESAGRPPTEHELSLGDIAGELAVSESCAVWLFRTGCSLWNARLQLPVQLGDQL